MPMMNFFATTTRGLENTCSAELSLLTGVHVTGVDYRRIQFAADGNLANLLGLRTVDDVFVLMSEWDSVAPQRSALQEMGQWAKKLTWGASLALVRSIRPLPDKPSFSVTVNFVGKRNYTSDEVKPVVAEAIQSTGGYAYGGENETDLNLRIFIDHEVALVGLRLSAQAMHSRTYKQAHISGSLKPSVAAAMLFIADAWTGARVVDPFCGAGTIPIEACLMGCSGMGGDCSPEAIAASRQNGKAAGVPCEFMAMDARHMPLKSYAAEFLVTNMPWGRQIKVDSELAELYHSTCLEMQRVLAARGKLVVLTSAPELLHFPELVQQNQVEISLFGQNPIISVFTR